MRSAVWLLMPPLLAQSGWTAPTVAVFPSARGGHGMAYDVVRTVTVLFGGEPHGFSDETWEWTGTRWHQRFPPVAPAPRAGFAFACQLPLGRCVLFGGVSARGVEGDTWAWDGSAWTPLAPANAPSPRERAAMAWLPGTNDLVLFGGLDAGGMLDDTWRWDGNDWSWSQPSPSPPARFAHALVADWAGRRVWLRGGRVGGAGEPWTFDGVTWTAVASAWPGPGAVMAPAVAFDQQRGLLVEFGGHSLSIGENAQTWRHDGDDWLLDARAGGPPARSDAAMVHDLVRGRLVLFGGSSNSSGLDDTWEYDLSGVATWRERGLGCGGGVPPYLHPGPGSRAVVGAPFRMVVRGAPGSGPAWLVLGWSPTWAGGPLPRDLAFVGLPGCQLHAAPDIVVPGTAAAGTATWSLPLPGNATLVGVGVHVQAFVPTPGGAVGAAASNGGIAVVGAF